MRHVYQKVYFEEPVRTNYHVLQNPIDVGSVANV